ncbi:hypothetical protein AB6E89_19515, partial [Vibrio breoganii]
DLIVRDKRLKCGVYDALTYKQLSWLVDNLENSVTMNSYKLSVCELIFISLILKVTNKLLSKNKLTLTPLEKNEARSGASLHLSISTSNPPTS